MPPLLLAILLAWAAIPDAHQQGVALYKQQKYSEAIPFLEEAIKTESPNGAEYKESALLIGQSYFMLSQSPKAIFWLEKIPSMNEANYMLGYAYLQSGDHERAEASFARLFGLKPESAAAHLLTAQMLLKKEFEPDAVTEANKALTADSNIPEARFLLAEIDIHRGKLDDAIDELRKELAVNPSFSMAWYRLGDAYSRQEKWDNAVANLQRAVWLNQDFSGPYILLGKCYFKMHNYSNAEGILRRGLVLDPNNYSGTYLLGQTLIAEGRKDEGTAILEKLKATKLQPQ